MKKKKEPIVKELTIAQEIAMYEAQVRNIKGKIAILKAARTLIRKRKAKP